MPLLINTESQLAEDLPQEQADAALQAGSHEIPLYDPKGELVTARLEDAANYLKQGYQQPNPDQLLSISRHAKFSSPAQQLKTGLEGAASAATFGLSTGAERAMGVDPEDIQARRETNPGIHAAGEAVGLLGSMAIPGVGAANLLEKAGAAGAKAVGLEVAAGAGLMKRVGSSAVKAAFENALFAGGDEASKLFSEDPNQSAETVAANLGLSALLGGGIGALTGAASGAYGLAKDKLVSQLDRPKIEAGEFRASIEASDLSPKEKAGIIEGLRKQKANAGEIKAAAAEINAPVLEGMISDSEIVRRGEDLLLNGPPTVPSIRRNMLYKEGYTRATTAVDNALGTGSQYSKAELGNLFKETITKQIDAEAGPIRELYETIKQYHEAIPLSEKSGPAIARNIGELKELRLSPSSPEGKLASRVIDEIENLKTVDDVKEYKSILNRSVSPTASPGEKRMISILNDKLSNLEENSILRFAKNNMKTPEAAAKVEAIIGARKEANVAYRDLMTKVSELSEKLGKGKVYGPQDAVNFIKDRLTPEEMVTKLFSKNDSEFLNFFSKNFPDQMQQMAQYQRGLIRENPAIPGEMRAPKEIFKIVNKLEPEIKAHLFTKEELGKLHAAETYIRAFPEKFNPSGTSHATAYRAFFEHPMGAAIANVRDFGIERFIMAVGDNPQMNLAARLAQAAVKGEALATTAVKGLFSSTKVLPQLEVSEKKREKLKEKLEEYSASPDKLLEAGVKDNPIPEYSTAFGTISARAVQYLNHVKPNVDKTGILDEEQKPTRIEAADYNRAIDIAEQPLIVLSHMKQGTLTSTDVDTLKAIYPGLYGRLAQKVTHEMIEQVSKGNPIPYKTRIQLAMFLNAPLDGTMTPQSIIAAQPKMPAQPEVPRMQPKRSTSPLSKMSGMYRTPGQSRELSRMGKP